MARGEGHQLGSKLELDLEHDELLLEPLEPLELDELPLELDVHHGQQEDGHQI